MAGGHQVLGFVLNDGTPLKSVEVQIDGGAWQRATLDPASTQYSWKLFTYRWEGATPGEHTLVSRAIDAKGVAQPAAADLSSKKTFLEDNSRWMDELKAQHKRAFDLVEVDLAGDARPLRFPRNYLDTFRDVYALEFPDVKT
jgi:hypothetical protein